MPCPRISVVFCLSDSEGKTRQIWCVRKRWHCTHPREYVGSLSVVTCPVAPAQFDWPVIACPAWMIVAFISAPEGSKPE